MKRISFSDDAKSDIRIIPQHIAMNILASIHRLAEDGSGDVKLLRNSAGEKRLRLGDYRVRFTEQADGALRIHSVKHRKDAYR